MALTFGSAFEEIDVHRAWSSSEYFSTFIKRKRTKMPAKPIVSPPIKSHGMAARMPAEEMLEEEYCSADSTAFISPVARPVMPEKTAP